jgi:nucleotide-binding universal stress UspA family protein
MATHTIISYDDTQNDQDALMLGRILGQAGSRLTLAYVRHTTQTEQSREQLDQQAAQALLDRGALWLGDNDVQRRVVVNASTAAGLTQLAEREDADVVVFGSEYRTAAGHVAPGQSAQALLEGGPTAVAIAPANYRTDNAPSINWIGVLPGSADDAALETARELASRFDAQLTDAHRGIDLLVVGSRQEAREGRVMITAQAQNAVQQATSPVLVVARGVPIRFQTLVTA